jgi:hypothetical protein
VCGVCVLCVCVGVWKDMRLFCCGHGSYSVHIAICTHMLDLSPFTFDYRVDNVWGGAFRKAAWDVLVTLVSDLTCGTPTPPLVLATLALLAKPCI